MAEDTYLPATDKEQSDAVGKIRNLTQGELELIDKVVASVTFTVGAQAGDVINVGLQLKDANGVDMAVRSSLLAYLSDDAAGGSIAAAAASGGVVIGTDGLAIPIVASKFFLLTSEADGDIDLDITEAGADTWFLIVVLPNGKLAPSGAITFV
jgi:hypothetical protein